MTGVNKETEDFRTIQYESIIDRYTNALTPYATDGSTKAEVRLIVSRLAREVMHWTNAYSAEVAMQVDSLLDKKGL